MQPVNLDHLSESWNLLEAMKKDIPVIEGKVRNGSVLVRCAPLACDALSTDPLAYTSDPCRQSRDTDTSAALVTLFQWRQYYAPYVSSSHGLDALYTYSIRAFEAGGALPWSTKA